MKLFTSKMASLAFFVVILSIYIVEIDKGTKSSAENDFISKNSMYMFGTAQLPRERCNSSILEVAMQTKRPPNGHEGEDTSHTYLDPVHFPRSKLSQIEVPVHPIRNTSYH
ncbi:hypothetical protein F2Q68_00037665 [Brassica cretica]|uniref:Uncharacterized protein n=1 Tax=Brassica cretica TaxID=69181 RepID=A0A8S9HCK4_BRACR|nr:hypothetical protein F2Q68_00037665 [Brassica cretica]